MGLGYSSVIEHLPKLLKPWIQAPALPETKTKTPPTRGITHTNQNEIGMDNGIPYILRGC